MDISGAKPIEIGNKPVFDQYFGQYPPEISEFTFTNLYMWRDYYHWEWVEVDNHLLIFSRDYLREHRTPIRGNPETMMFMPPVGNDPGLLICALFEELGGIEFHRVPRSLWEVLLQGNDRVAVLGIQWQDDRDNWDYVYERNAIATLGGGTLKPKRKWLNRFMEHYQYEFRSISPDEPELLACCRAAQETWCALNACEDTPALSYEHDAILDAFDHYIDLRYGGSLILIDNDCIAYTLGERLNADTLVVHIEKAHAHIDGAYQGIMSLFLQRPDFAAIPFVNREQDVGEPGLRRAKESYAPHHMVEKGILFM
ncbi:MAG TPA: phosphatidylglycerol lysyltransferase domain-containing protein [Candidatus Lokiarchaeia archaeon]|nr:phosphatidylglycerol lysyltransferase domain-containing protein [Candidatus Lokiarchaeia archaeon]